MPAHLNLLSFSAISKMDSNCPLITHARYNTYNEPSNKERQLPDSHLAYLAHASLWALKQLNTRMDSTMGSDPAWPYVCSLRVKAIEHDHVLRLDSPYTRYGTPHS